jgi:AcrR family transcriptional regulator
MSSSICTGSATSSNEPTRPIKTGVERKGKQMMQVQEVMEETRQIDGRRQRTVDSRARIVSAMLELTHAGHVAVSAELVAERANVGLRTVFRHFNDMDSLYREMSLAIERRLREEVPLGFATTDWREQVAELIRRRSGIFEKIAPYKRAEAAHRHRSKVLAQDIERLNMFLREMLRSVLPTAVARDQLLFEALDMILSFETWERLRRDQDLSPRRAREVLEGAVDKLLAGAELS